jgi:transmembrane sensor
VTLNANSKLTYTDNWRQAGQRTVMLEGEAFFKVSHQEQSTNAGKEPVKFTVKSGDMDIEVVGTEFTVNNRRKRTRVALYQGIVRLQHAARKQSAVIMQPGETAEFADGQQAIALQRKPSETRWVWKTNNLVFKAATLQQVAQTLEDNYGLHIVFEPATLASQKFAGEVSEGKTDVLLTAVADAFGCQIRKEGEQIIIYK